MATRQFTRLILSLTFTICIVAAANAANIHVVYPDSIQAAIDAASTGDRVLVHSGTYQITSGKFNGLHGIVIVGKDIQLIAVPDEGPVNIVAAADFRGALVYVQDALVTVEGFSIDGLGLQLTGSSDDRPYGIYFKNASGQILNNAVNGIKTPSCPGCQGGVGIYVRDFFGDGNTIRKTDVTIMNNTITDYQKGGIVANGEEVSARIHNNSVTGWGQTSFIAQNGIQVGWDATASVLKNIVFGNWYSGEGWTSCGILVYPGQNVRVVNNKVLENQTGIYFAGGNNNKMINNLITGSNPGWEYFDIADFSKIHANRFE